MTIDSRPIDIDTYEGEPCCGNDEDLTNKQKEERCCAMFNWMQYAMTFLTDKVRYFRDLTREYLFLYSDIIRIDLNISTNKDDILTLSKDIIIPTVETYTSSEIDNKMCAISNDVISYDMNKKSCCCKPWVEILT